MMKSVVAFILGCSVIAAAQTQQAKPAAKPSAPPLQLRSGYILPADVNVRIEPDARTFIVMAAVNMAGFDYESSGQPLSPARAELRKDLASLDPQLKARLAAFYQAHRRAGVDEGLDATRYATLSLLMTPPPAFTIYPSPEQPLPEDLASLVEFAPLVREFYLKSNIKSLIPKYVGVGGAYAAAYRQPIGELIYQTLDYFHTTPETIINMRPLVVKDNSTEVTSKSAKQTIVRRNRTRQVFVIPDPLSALSTSLVRGDILNQQVELTRRVGDDYVVIIGPSREYITDAARQALIRFVIDPLVERHLKASLEYKDQIVKLVASVPTAGRAFGTSVYLVVRESLAQAAEARLRRLQAMSGGAAYGEDDATFDLAQGYLRGAVLSFHFYEALKGLEAVGISIEDFFEQMVATAKWEREATRAREFEPVVARVSAARRAKAAKPNDASATDAAFGPVTKRILQSDDLIRQRKYAEAKGILESVLGVEPNNVRALYGMAQVVSQMPSPVEADPKGEENDKIQAQHDRLEQAIKLYRKVIATASPDNEAWLIQWSHVLLGRIYDFQEFRNDALVEYEKAIAMGDVKNGALKEAIEGKARPYGQKN